MSAQPVGSGALNAFEWIAKYSDETEWNCYHISLLFSPEDCLCFRRISSILLHLISLAISYHSRVPACNRFLSFVEPSIGWSRQRWHSKKNSLKFFRFFSNCNSQDDKSVFARCIPSSNQTCTRVRLMIMALSFGFAYEETKDNNTNERSGWPNHQLCDAHCSTFLYSNDLFHISPLVDAYPSHRRYFPFQPFVGNFLFKE